ncbi:hypothetical protein ACFQ3R_04725 [Mesonia ostreae]|uniref:Uncharacterized protein n=1 Tax=Mesonia ostreae TaxID=861110 RepID=A0ABU2KKC9_9FLAO|nr:hypothetical protein [Mesonia ostreae]MDT0295118.1 hypothetical protein [Mesonia ostreae]
MLIKPLWPIVDYVINYDHIVSTLCENKDKPKMECNGKCYLSKMLAKEASEETENPFSHETSKTEIPHVIISECIAAYIFTPEVILDAKENIAYHSTLNSFQFISKLYHPPELG